MSPYTGGHPIACPFLKQYADEAKAMPAKCKTAAGAPIGGVEIDHWLGKILDLAQKATECPSRETGSKEQGRYEVTRKRALAVIWEAYMEIQTMSEGLTNGKYEITESHSEVHQRLREGIKITSVDVEDL